MKIGGRNSEVSILRNALEEGGAIGWGGAGALVFACCRENSLEASMGGRFCRIASMSMSGSFRDSSAAIALLERMAYRARL